MERKANYTKEFKIQACELVVKNGLKVKVVAEKMGISHIMLYRWIDQYNLNADVPRLLRRSK